LKEKLERIPSFKPTDYPPTPRRRLSQAKALLSSTWVTVDEFDASSLQTQIDSIDIELLGAKKKHAEKKCT
jgi:hypothetical protein